MNYLYSCLRALTKAVIFLPYLVYRRVLYGIGGTPEEQEKLGIIDAELRHREGRELKPPEE